MSGRPIHEAGLTSAAINIVVENAAELGEPVLNAPEVLMRRRIWEVAFESVGTRRAEAYFRGRARHGTES